MKEVFKEFFHYTRSERNGLFVLTSICVVLMITPTIYRHLFKVKEKTDFSQFQNQIDSFYQNYNQENTTSNVAQLFPFDPNKASKEDFRKLGLSEKVASTIENYRNKGGKFYKKEDFKKIYGITESDFDRLEEYIILDDDRQKQAFEKNFIEEETQTVAELFEFDPNTVSREDLKRLGLSQKAINIMMNYRKKGGTFRKREDLSKIYGISEVDFERLFPYIKIPEKKPAGLLTNNEPEIPQSSDSQSIVKIEVNSATPEEWQLLKGIGPYFSKKICEFRDRLGGFVSIEQIAQTYNLPDSTFQKIKPFLVLEGPVKKINLNTALAKELAVHPYLNWKQANVIVKYRDQHGDFTSINQLDNIKVLDKKTLKNVKPYLEVE